MLLSRYQKTYKELRELLLLDALDVLVLIGAAYLCNLGLHLDRSLADELVHPQVLPAYIRHLVKNTE